MSPREQGWQVAGVVALVLAAIMIARAWWTSVGSDHFPAFLAISAVSFLIGSFACFSQARKIKR